MHELSQMQAQKKVYFQQKARVNANVRLVKKTFCLQIPNCSKLGYLSQRSVPFAQFTKKTISFMIAPMCTPFGKGLAIGGLIF